MNQKPPQLQLNVTPTEFAEMLRLAYLGEWVVNSQHAGEHQDERAARALQLLLALGERLSPDVIDRDAETGQFFVRPELAERWQDEYVADYDDHIFWQELAERLAERDLAAQLGVDVTELDVEEQVAELRPLRERYWREFDDNGLERFIVGDEID